MPQSRAMLDPSARPDVATLLGTGTPAEAMSAIADRFESLGADDQAWIREEVVRSVAELFARGAPSKPDWFEPLVANPVIHARANGADPPPDDGSTLDARLQRLVLDALDAMAPEERGRRLGIIAHSATDISLLCASITALEQERDGGYLGEASPDVRKVLLERIGALAATSAFWALRFPAALLWFWFAHGEEQRVYLFTSRAMEDPFGLAALLTIPLERVKTGDEQQDIVAVRRWSRIIDFQALEARAVTLAMSAPSRTDRRRARRFLDAFGAGKSELFR